MFTIIVEWIASDGDHRNLTRGDHDLSTVQVLADSAAEAHIIAAQMVACRPGIIPIRTWLDPLP